MFSVLLVMLTLGAALSAVGTLSESELKTYKALVIDVARGKHVDTQLIRETCLLVARTLRQFESDVRRLVERIERQAAYDATDYKSRMETNLVERRDVVGTLEELQRQKDEIQEKLRAAHERNKTLLSAGSRIQDESRRSRNELIDLMRRTGDINDPEKFTLTD